MRRRLIPVVVASLLVAACSSGESVITSGNDEPATEEPDEPATEQPATDAPADEPAADEPADEPQTLSITGWVRTGTGQPVAGLGVEATLTRAFDASEPTQIYKRFVDQCLRDKGYQPIGWR